MTLYYVAHRLFAAHDRALGACIAQRLGHAAGADSVFLPFCDTDEENLQSDCKGRLLFELDRARLRRITGMIAVLHGPSLDDGVCMEIGYAAAAGIPVVLVSTDFQTYAPAASDREFTFPDPLLDHLAATVLRAHRLGAATHDQQRGAGRFRAFLEQNAATVRRAADQATTALLRASQASSSDEPRGKQRRDLALVEPSPYFDDPAWEAIASDLRSRGWHVRVSQRLRDGTDPAESARDDWQAATQASLAVIDARGPETPPGSALIAGALTALGRPVIAACHDTWQTLADGREPNFRNLMIQYAITARFRGTAQFTAVMDSLPCTPA